ncbi:hypothetical protein [Undibacterium sp. Tian12W]|uniref:hypothetical protein n=1 Tax=Undibacterium sp. Tian12W TaxID=3413054 RepID=UPI003BEF8EA2
MSIYKPFKDDELELYDPYQRDLRLYDNNDYLDDLSRLDSKSAVLPANAVVRQAWAYTSPDSDDGSNNAVLPSVIPGHDWEQPIFLRSPQSYDQNPDDYPRNDDLNLIGGGAIPTVVRGLLAMNGPDNRLDSYSKNLSDRAQTLLLNDSNDGDYIVDNEPDNGRNDARVSPGIPDDHYDNTRLDGREVDDNYKPQAVPLVSRKLKVKPVDKPEIKSGPLPPEVLFSRADTLFNAANWARSQGMKSAADEYQRDAQAHLYAANAERNRLANVRIEGASSSYRSIPVNPFYPGWGTGEAQAGIPSGTSRLPDGSYGAGLYMGLGGEFELGLENNRVTDVKLGLGVGAGGHAHLGSKKINKDILRGPGGNWKNDLDFLNYGQKQLPGDFRVGPSLTLGVGLGPVGVEGAMSGGVYSNNDGNKGGFFEVKPSMTVSPAALKAQAEAKLNIMEFAYKRRNEQK